MSFAFCGPAVGVKGAKSQQARGRVSLRQSCGNTPVGTPIFIVNATDPDLGAGGSVLYSFQPPSQFFAIDSARGIVTVIQELDYEITQAYQLTVNATDQDKTRPLSTLANLAIIITDIQDMDPIFINLPYSTNIYEHSPPGTTVRVITAIDQDKGRPRGIGYTIISDILLDGSGEQGARTWPEVMARLEIVPAVTLGGHPPGHWSISGLCWVPGHQPQTLRSSLTFTDGPGHPFPLEQDAPGQSCFGIWAGL
eukprot:bmy_22033T0